MSFNASHAPVAHGVQQIQQGLREATLMDTTPAVAVQIPDYLNDKHSLDMINSLKQQTHGPCRALYGSDRSRFYDVHISYSKARGFFRARLIYALGNRVKILREVISDHPVKALQEMVDRLCEDLDAVYAENDVGCEIDGQQGYTDKKGSWVVIPMWKAGRVEAVDATMQGDSYVPNNAPRGPRGRKRMRMEDSRMISGAPLILSYDD